jgi:hypothetical protein
MPGRRGKNLRSGDLAEELGILLLKGIAAVAEVPRPEDIGFDGVATLLREDDAGFLYAQDSFYVQFKSASVRILVYEGHEAEWLTKLKLPFFIGSVDSKDSRISLYTTIRVSQVVLETKYHKLSLHLDSYQEGNDPRGERSFNIGPPLLTWGFQDLQNPEFRAKAFRMLKTAIEIEERNIRHRPVKYGEMFKWITNENVELTGSALTGGGQSKIPIILESMAPYMSALTMEYLDLRGKDTRDVEALVGFLNYMARQDQRFSDLVQSFSLMASLHTQHLEDLARKNTN